MKKLPSGRNAASKRLTKNTNETLNLRAIRASEEGFSHKREMKRNYAGSKTQKEHRKGGKT